MSKYIVILSMCLCSALAENLVRDWSFEENKFWRYYKRTGGASVNETNTFVSSVTVVKNLGHGARAARFTKLSLKSSPSTAAFVSQYIKVEDNLHSRCDGNATCLQPSSQMLQLIYFVKGQDATMMMANLIIHYEDGRHMTIHTSTPNAGILSFSKNCFAFPAYGKVKFLMLYFSLENNTANVFFLDDVSLEFVVNPELGCNLYNSTVPVLRQMTPNFLQPNRSLQSEASITLATQLTMDRLPILERTVTAWQGPVSATVYLNDPLDTPKDLASLISRFHSNEEMRKHLTVHLAFPDVFNPLSNVSYPANALRNLAIAFSHTAYVFYSDVDWHVPYSAADLELWLRQAHQELGYVNSTCDTCAFVVLPFDLGLYRPCQKISRNKSELWTQITTDQDIKFTKASSHPYINVRWWFSNNKTFELNYTHNMYVPTIVARNRTQLLSELYQGYGMDKASHVYDLHQNGFKFYVLPEAFVVFVKNMFLKSSPTIQDVDGGGLMRLSAHVSALLHHEEVKDKYFLTMNKFLARFVSTNNSNDCLSPRQPVATSCDCLRYLGILFIVTHLYRACCYVKRKYFVCSGCHLKNWVNRKPLEKKKVG